MFRKSVDVLQKDQVSSALDTPEVGRLHPQVSDVGVTVSEVEVTASDVGLSGGRVDLTASGVGMSVGRVGVSESRVRVEHGSG